MLFSVIVPIYNVEKYLHKCIQSIIGQSYKNFELILVDDGSSDGCGAICDEYVKCDSRIYVIHKKNGGLVSARKAGLSAANGDYVFNIDGDDYIDEHLFQEIAEIAEQYEPGVIVFEPVKVVENETIFSEKQLKKGLYVGSKLDEVKKTIVCHPSMRNFRGTVDRGIALKAVKKELLVSYQMSVPNSIKIGEDFAVTIPAILNADRVYFSDIDGYYYRIHDASITHTFDKHAIEDLCNLVAYLDATLDYERHNIKSQMAGYITGRLFYALAAACRGMKHYSDYQQFTKKINPRLLDKIADYHIPFII